MPSKKVSKEKEKSLKQKAAQVLTAAANRIKKYGWVQGRMGNAVSGYCAVGALDEATRYRKLPRKAMLLAEKELRKLTKHQSVIKFNDTPGRTKDQVLTVFEKALTRLLKA